MFEKWFGGKKKVEGINSDKNSVEGVAHFDGTKTEKEFKSEADSMQDNFPSIDTRKYQPEVMHRDEYKDVRTSRNATNERSKQKITELHSDWKEQEPFALNLPDEDEETIDEKHLNALAESYDDEDDFEEEHRKAA
jgi:hypothetical protein